MATTTAGPISISQINNIFYVGEDALDTIQDAVDYIQQFNGGVGQVVIVQGYTGSEAISTIVNGAATIFISDRRNAAAQDYVWSGSAFVPADFSQKRGFVTTGIPAVIPPGSAALFFDPAGTSGSGSVDLRVTGNTGQSVPAFNLQIVKADGTQFHTYIRAALDSNGDALLTIPESTTITGDLSVSADLKAATAEIADTLTANTAAVTGELTADSATIAGTVTTLSLVATGNSAIQGTLTLSSDLAIFGDCGVKGNLTLANDPTQPQQAATKNYVDEAIIAAQVFPPLGIPTSTGAAWGASIDPATLAYVNAANVFTLDQTMSKNLSVGGTLTLSADPTQPLQAATRHYVDQAVTDAGGFVFPPAGVPTSTGAAWGASIDPATIAYINAANVFMQTQRTNGVFAAYGAASPLDVSKSAVTIGAGYQSTHPNLTLINASEPANNRAWAIAVFPDSGQGPVMGFTLEDDGGNVASWMIVWRNGLVATKAEIKPPLTLDGQLNASGGISSGASGRAQIMAGGGGYSAITLNGTTAAGADIGIVGGGFYDYPTNANPDPTLYIDTPAGGTFSFRAGGTNAATIDATGDLNLLGSVTCNNGNLGLGNSQQFPNMAYISGDSGGNIGISAGKEGAVYFNFDKGTGINFGDGAGHTVGSLDYTGNLTVSGTTITTTPLLVAGTSDPTLIGNAGTNRLALFANNTNPFITHLSANGTASQYGVLQIGVCQPGGAGWKNIMGVSAGGISTGAADGSGNLWLGTSNSNVADDTVVAARLQLGVSGQTSVNYPAYFQFNTYYPASPAGDAHNAIMDIRLKSSQPVTTGPLLSLDGHGAMNVAGYVQAAGGLFGQYYPTGTDFNTMTSPGFFGVDGVTVVCPNSPTGGVGLWGIWIIGIGAGANLYMCQFATIVDDWSDVNRWVAMRKQNPNGWGTWGFLRQS